MASDSTESTESIESIHNEKKMKILINELDNLKVPLYLLQFPKSYKEEKREKENMLTNKLSKKKIDEIKQSIQKLNQLIKISTAFFCYEMYSEMLLLNDLYDAYINKNITNKSKKKSTKNLYAFTPDKLEIINNRLYPYAKFFFVNMHYHYVLRKNKLTAFCLYDYSCRDLLFFRNLDYVFAKEYEKEPEDCIIDINTLEKSYCSCGKTYYKIKDNIDIMNLLLFDINCKYPLITIEYLIK